MDSNEINQLNNKVSQLKTYNYEKIYSNTGLPGYHGWHHGPGTPDV